LKEIITLNQTKEGIVVQFLPEAKDFWVSLNQVVKINDKIYAQYKSALYLWRVIKTKQDESERHQNRDQIQERQNGARGNLDRPYNREGNYISHKENIP